MTTTQTNRPPFTPGLRPRPQTHRGSGSRGAFLTQERLRERLHYDPETGIFTWRPRGIRWWDDKHAGKQAGGIEKNRGRLLYLRITIDGKRYNAHRLVFLYMTGSLPPIEVDHRDGDGLNNRWLNLRAANQAQNQANSSIRSDNTTGLKGVTLHKQTHRYEAQIRISGKQRSLGSFDTPEEAHAAYIAAAEKHFGEFARTS